ncbi:MAG: hypothetical protein ACRBF0_02410 [Calditrichia bacterium]
MMERPQFIRDEHLTLLSDLDKKVTMDMFLAVPQLRLSFPELDSYQAQQTLLFWMHAIHNPVEELVAV